MNHRTITTDRTTVTDHTITTGHAMITDQAIVTDHTVFERAVDHLRAASGPQRAIADFAAAFAGHVCWEPVDDESRLEVAALTAGALQVGPGEILSDLLCDLESVVVQHIERSESRLVAR